LNEYTIQ